MSNYYVDLILRDKKITDFLQDRGIFPVRESRGKILYKCPIHSGDNDPSFIVYPIGTKGRDYETYYCFGCKSGVNVINLKSDLDGVSIKEAINYFLEGMDINPKEELDSNIDALLNDIYKQEKTDSRTDGKIEMLMLLLNTTCREYLKEYGDSEEVRFFDDKFYRKVDSIARSGDVDTLEAYYNMLIENDILVRRAEVIQKKNEEEELSRSKWII